jgi:hypothetical protein
MKPTDFATMAEWRAAEALAVRRKRLVLPISVACGAIGLFAMLAGLPSVIGWVFGALALGAPFLIRKIAG